MRKLSRKGQSALSEVERCQKVEDPTNVIAGDTLPPTHCENLGSDGIPHSQCLSDAVLGHLFSVLNGLSPRVASLGGAVDL